MEKKRGPWERLELLSSSCPAVGFLVLLLASSCPAVVLLLSPEFSNLRFIGLLRTPAAAKTRLDDSPARHTLPASGLTPQFCWKRKVNLFVNPFMSMLSGKATSH